jgi:aarF domain-containing kinase
LREGRSTAEDALQVLQETGPEAVIRRTLEGQRALFETSLELAQELPTPPVLVPGTDPSEAIADYVKQLPPELAPRTLRKLFERLGATYLKLGQFIASSPTLFPEEYVLEFQACLDRTPTIPFKEVRGIVESDLGRPLSSLFASVEEEPLASASIAQVHAARLKTGEDVVIKVRKPGVDNTLKADLGFLAVASNLLEVIVPDFDRFSLAGIISDLRTSMLEELDFENEARNIDVFSKFLDETNMRGMATQPTIYRDFSGKQVLTMERLYGSSITDADAIRAKGNDPEQVLLNALNVWSLSVITAESFHADVHGGNVMALDDGRVGFIDFGIVGRVPEKIWEAVKAFGAATVKGDDIEMARALISMGATKGQVDEVAFAADIKDVMQQLQTIDPDLTVSFDGASVVGNVSVADDEVTKLVLTVVRTADRNGVKLPREFGLLLKQYLYFDRFTRILAPDVDVMKDDRLTIGRAMGAIDVTGDAPTVNFG